MTTEVKVTVAGHQVKVTQSQSGETLLKVKGETHTFYAHSTNEVDIAETGELSISQVDQMNVAGSARQLTDNDFKNAGG